MSELPEQRRVGIAVERRGYREGWRAHEFAARQVAKLAEELWELSEHVGLPGALPLQLRVAGQAGKQAFDNEQCWGGGQVFDVGQAKRELSDIVVVALALADVLDEIAPPFDVVAEAVAKAEADVERGVR